MGRCHRHFKMHQTILRKGRDLFLSIERCTVCCRRYHCAYCKLVFNHLNEVQNHIIEHVRVAVHHEDFVIIKCSVDCRKAEHFHCRYCTSTLIRRDALIKHLTSCKNTSSGQPPPTEPAATPSFPAASSPSPAALFPATQSMTTTTRVHDSAVMKQIHFASDWVEENRTHFTGKVHLPQITRMNEDDALLAITM